MALDNKVWVQHVLVDYFIITITNIWYNNCNETPTFGLECTLDDYDCFTTQLNHNLENFTFYQTLILKIDYPNVSMLEYTGEYRYGKEHPSKISFYSCS